MCVPFWVIFFPATCLMGQKLLLTALWFNNYLCVAYASVSLHVKWGQVAPFIVGLWQLMDKPQRLASSEQLQWMLTVIVLLVRNSCDFLLFRCFADQTSEGCLAVRANGFPHMPKALFRSSEVCIITCHPDSPYSWLVKVLDLVWVVTFTSSTYSEP